MGSPLVIVCNWECRGSGWGGGYGWIDPRDFQYHLYDGGGLKDCPGKPQTSQEGKSRTYQGGLCLFSCHLPPMKSVSVHPRLGFGLRSGDMENQAGHFKASTAESASKSDSRCCLIQGVP